MIVNPPQPDLEARLRTEAGSNPVAGAVSSAVAASPDPFEVSVEAAGLDVRPCGYLDSGLPNRAHMKVFSPQPGHTLVFFYKKSLVPYSRDRYSYGGIDLRTPQVSAEEVAEWLNFLRSGFHPEKRPSHLRRAFPYEIPE